MPQDNIFKNKIISVLPAHKNLQAKTDREIRNLSNIVTEGTLQNNYRILGKKGEGTFSEVLKCQSIKDGQMFACKKMKQKYETIEQVCNLREVQAMRRLNPHVNVVNLHEIVFDRRNGTVALVCELMEMNLYELIRGRRKMLSENIVKKYMYQLLKALEHMHRIGIFHRDIKPENILLKDDHIKLADYGSVRSVYSKPPYTEYISTRWYRAPECLLTDGYYSYKMDLWSVGCVFHEVLCLHPLFPGQNEIDQVAKIHDVLGTPSKEVLDKFKHRNHAIDFNFPPKKGSGIEKHLPHVSSLAIDLIYRLVYYDFESRITSKQALYDKYFKDEREHDKRYDSLNVTRKSVGNALMAGIGNSPRLSKAMNQNRASKLVPDQNAKPLIKDHKGGGNFYLPKISTKGASSNVYKGKISHGANMLNDAQNAMNKTKNTKYSYFNRNNQQNAGLYKKSNYQSTQNKYNPAQNNSSSKTNKTSYNQYGPTLPAFKSNNNKDTGKITPISNNNNNNNQSSTQNNKKHDKYGSNSNNNNNNSYASNSKTNNSYKAPTSYKPNYLNSSKKFTTQKNNNNSKAKANTLSYSLKDNDYSNQNESQNNNKSNNHSNIDPTAGFAEPGFNYTFSKLPNIKHKKGHKK